MCFPFANETHASPDDFWLSSSRRLAQKHLDNALSIQEDNERRDIFRAKEQSQSLSQIKKAIAIDPTFAEAHFQLAERLYEQERDKAKSLPGLKGASGTGSTPLEQAIHHWNQFQSLAPNDTRLKAMLFKRSLSYTKLGADTNFRKAIRDYQHILRLHSFDTVGDLLTAPPNTRFLAQIYTNTAELMMAVGDLDEAIGAYERGNFLEPNLLHKIGLAVALDRRGDHGRAKELFRNVTMESVHRTLTNGSVYFVPEGDVDFYFALASEHLGRTKEAIAFYRSFLDRVPNSQYRSTALGHIAKLSRKP